MPDWLVTAAKWTLWTTSIVGVVYLIVIAATLTAVFTTGDRSDDGHR
jgi:hypothetical protein